MGKKVHFCLLFLIIALAAALRLINFPYRYGLGGETVRDAVIGIEAARQLQLPLTGAFSSLGPFTFGPLYAYQLALATLIFRSVYSPWIYLTLMSILYVLVIYKVGESLLGKGFGLLLAFFAAISPAQIISAVHLTSHNLTNIFAVLAIWLFLALFQKRKSAWRGFWLGITIGTAMNLHYQMIGLLILPVLLVVAKRKNYLHLLMAVAGVAFTFLPLLFFELNNHWFNIRNMLDYLANGRKQIYVPNRWLFYVRDFWPGFWADAFGIPTAFSKLVMLASALAVVLSFLRKKFSKLLLLLTLAFLFNFVILRYYWGERFYGYLNFLRPYVFIFTGYLFFCLWQQKITKYLTIPFLTLFIVFPLTRIRSNFAPDVFSQTMYTQMALAEKRISFQKYQIYDCGLKFNEYYTGITFSLAFIAELHQKFSVTEAKLGLWQEGCKYPTAQQELYPKVNNLGLIDLSRASEKDLLTSGWHPLSFQRIYDQNARWWFQLQP